MQQSEGSAKDTVSEDEEPEANEGQEIDDALFISRRVLQRHVAAIYEKTGTKSRVGLYMLYHKASMGD